MKMLGKRRGSSVGMSLALLFLRLTLGCFLMGHGGQKLFGWFKGPGMQGTATWLESMGMRPGKAWAALAGGSEFGGGLLTVLGFLNPIGPLASFGAMAMATAKVHWGKPIWVSQGGAEHPITNMGIASALMAAGPGAYSLDALLGIRLPRWLLIPGFVGIAGTVAYAFYANRLPKLQQVQQQVQQQVTQAVQSAQRIVQHTVQRTRTTSPRQPASTGATGTASATDRKATQPAGTP
jgi:putative oxidoreductase